MKDLTDFLPFFINPFFELSIVGPVTGTFNAVDISFVEEDKIYTRGDQIDFYMEVRGFDDVLSPDVTLSLVVANAEGDVVDRGVVEQFNEEYGEAVEALTVNFGYDTSSLTSGVYFFKFIAEDHNAQAQTEKYMRLELG